MARLAALRFEWVLPGHGRPWRAPSAEVARREVARLAAAMRGGR
jgi:glyoxylase-like metal-dependent hydrolase (beta-lactamase superfamily II)